MYIMSTGMHDAGVGRGIGNLILFQDRKSIHICPQGDNSGRGVFPFNQTDYAGFSLDGERNAQDA
jgi:hypothetical protein